MKLASMIKFLPQSVPATLVSIHLRFSMNTYQDEGTSRGK